MAHITPSPGLFHLPTSHHHNSLLSLETARCCSLYYLRQKPSGFAHFPALIASRNYANVHIWVMLLFLCWHKVFIQLRFLPLSKACEDFSLNGKLVWLGILERNSSVPLSRSGWKNCLCFTSSSSSARERHNEPGVERRVRNLRITNSRQHRPRAIQERTA